MSDKTKSLYGVEKARVIHVFKNGDKFEKKGQRVIINSAKIKSFDQVSHTFILSGLIITLSRY